MKKHLALFFMLPLMAAWSFEKAQATSPEEDTVETFLKEGMTDYEKEFGYEKELGKTHEEGLEAKPTSTPVDHGDHKDTPDDGETTQEITTQPVVKQGKIHKLARKIKQAFMSSKDKAAYRKERHKKHKVPEAKADAFGMTLPSEAWNAMACDIPKNNIQQVVIIAQNRDLECFVLGRPEHNNDKINFTTIYKKLDGTDKTSSSVEGRRQKKHKKPSWLKRLFSKKKHAPQEGTVSNLPDFHDGALHLAKIAHIEQGGQVLILNVNDIGDKRFPLKLKLCLPQEMNPPTIYSKTNITNARGFQEVQWNPASDAKEAPGTQRRCTDLEEKARKRNKIRITS